MRRGRLAALSLLLIGFNIAAWLRATVAFRNHANLLSQALLV